MLPRQMSRTALTAVVVLSMSPANAQNYGNGCSSCGPVAATASSCVPIQPVQVSCTQRVPVTTYRQEERTVRQPYYRTEYEEREVTVMRPVTTQREIEIPTVSYRNVTEQRTVQRDMGRWITRYTPNQKCAPCQVDARPGFIGWLNRTGYSFRTAFQPNYHTSRQYVPQMMACTVPVTRQVAVRGTRRVTVNETRMVADKKMERVAVQKLDYRQQVVKVMTPQTAYRDVPIGTQTAFGYGGGFGYGTQTALTPYFVDSPRTARSPDPRPDPISRSADSEKRKPMWDDDRPQKRAEKETFRPSGLEQPLEATPGDDDIFFNEPGVSRERNRDRLVIPAKYSRQPRQAESGWRQTTRKTARRSSSRSASSRTQVTMTQQSED